jgi:HAD superfamily hydrolase (TIGR01509 family)
MLKAILFDLDGTLIDSEHFYLDSWNEILTEAGAQLTFDDWNSNYMGTTVHANAQKLKEKYNIPDPIDELIARRRQLTINRFKTTDVGLMPFVRENLEYYQTKGLKMAVATSSQREDVDAIFERNGLAPFFEFIITRNDVANGKPHPESYLRCVEQLGVQKHECVVFEDTYTGVTAAKAAGLTCYAIQSNIAEHPKLTAADGIFIDLNQAREHLIKMQLF